jgi:succinate dehydrogenase/fumarate reductase flavoprotein subunit
LLNDVKAIGTDQEMNTALKKAFWLNDFKELEILKGTDAVQREESYGSRFREEFQTKEREALRPDEGYSDVSACEYRENGFILHKEFLEFLPVKPTLRRYK